MKKNDPEIANDFFKYKKFKESYFFLIIGIIITSFLIRIYFIDFELPLTLDSLEYFSYANEIKIQGMLPINYSLDNNGWPIFLSSFFMIFQFEDSLSYMNLQKILSISISILTIIPIYYLSRKFFEKKLSLFCVALFAFEPRLSINSLFGITEPLYIFLIVSSMVLFLNKNEKVVMISFALASLSIIVRSEGFFFFITLSIMFFIRYRKNKKILTYAIAFVIFAIILLPYLSYQTEILGNDRVTGRIVQGVSFLDFNYEKIFEGFKNYFKFFGWNLIPIFIFLIPFGLKEFFKKINFEKLFIMIFFVVMSLPALFAYYVTALDTRFLYVFFPFLCIISTITFRKFVGRIQHDKIVYPIVFGVLILVSVVFIDRYSADNVHEKESFLIATEIIDKVGFVNSYYPESKYLSSAKFLEVLPNSTAGMKRPYIHDTILNYQTLEEYLLTEKENGLTHLVVDNSQNRSPLLKQVYNNEKNFVYLDKIYDSSEEKISYHLKVFKINYDLLATYEQK